MGFFDKIGKAFKSVGSGFVSGIKKVTKPIGSFFKNTVYKKGLKPLYNKGIKPVVNKYVQLINNNMKRFERVADAGTKAAEGAGDAAAGLGSFLSNPLGIMAAGAGIIVVTSMIKN